MLRIGFYQFRPWFGQVKKNLDKVVQALQDVSADLVVLPELPFTPTEFLLMLHPDPNHPLRQDIDPIEKAAQRATNLTRQLLSG